ncbi:MAG: hypothetical protein KatS3mg124_2460 [Porticoccaceae bacterium]|nr:MAG: hypothetical protein KatS3mg124_2460 [Porticoccaceae bacterium]
MLADRLVAHRGYRARYPENTLAAVRAALAAGARYLEVDVQLTADRVPVLLHDADLARVAGRPDSIFDLPAAVAEELSVHEPGRLGEAFRGERLPRLAALAALLAQWPEVTAFVEVKEESLERFGTEPVLAAVLAALAPLSAQAVPISFSAAFAARVRAAGWPRVGVVLRRPPEPGDPALAGCEFAFVDQRRLPGAGPLPRLGPRLVVYEVGCARRARRLFDRGADLVETFDIGALRAALAQGAP